MEIKGSYDLQGSKSEVWETLNSAQCLQRIIPGCTSVQATDDTTFLAKIVTRVGPLKVNFSGIAKFQNIKPFDSFTIDGKGEGGPAGFAKGTVEISLEALEPGKTRLTYVAKTSLGGKLASLGGRLLEAISHRNIDQFFTALQSELSGDIASELPGSSAPLTTIAPPAHQSYLPLVNTVSLVAIAVALWVIALS